MKRIEAIIRPTEVGKVCLSLEKAGCPHPRISQIEGECQKGSVYLLRGKTYNVDSMIKARVEVIAEDGEADNVLNAIRDAAFTGESGDDRIFVYEMADALCR